MQSFFRYTGIFLLLFMSACSTVIEGRTQKIAVDTFPIGAECVVKDNDLILAKVHSPGVAVVEKSKNDILVECSKEGYITNKKRNRSDVAISSVANMAFGQWSFVGNMVDSASGASHKYDSKVFIGLTPLPPVAQMTAEVSPAMDTSHKVAFPTPKDWTTMPPEQVAQQLAAVLSTEKVEVTQRPVDEVIRSLTGRAAQTEGLAQFPTQHVAMADLQGAIFHQAE